MRDFKSWLEVATTPVLVVLTLITLATLGFL